MIEIAPVILALAGLLVFCSLLLPLADRLSLPFTLLLALLGIVLGLGAVGAEHLVERMIPESTAFARDFLLGLSEIGLTADAFLLLFLPPLLFTAGLGVDLRLLLDEFAAVLVLAVVAVLICTGVIGLGLAAISQTSLVVCLLLGSIVATTDPAAVLATFRDLGAPRRLSTLIAGESLFNDAAAIALFVVLVDILTDRGTLNVGEDAFALVVSLVGGAVLGVVLARIAGVALVYLRASRAAAVTLAVALAYLSYLLGEVYFEVSGVVAVVCAALTLSVIGPTRLAPEIWSAMQRAWDQFDFWATSLIFVLASMLAVRALPQATWTDLALLLALVAAALLARGLVLFGLLPMLSLGRLAHPINQRAKLFILWGGLRGAVTLVLALSISQNAEIPAEARRFVEVLATGFVFFTLFVQAPTLQPLLRLLHLDRLSATEQALRNRVIALSRDQIHRQVQTTARDYGFDPGLAEGLTEGVQVAEEPEALSLEQRERVGLLALANREKELYLEHFQAQSISSRLVGPLAATSDRLLDAVRAEGAAGYETTGDRLVRLTSALRFAVLVQRKTGSTWLLARELADRFELLMIMQMVIRELLSFNKRSLAPLVGSEATGSMERLLRQRLSRVEDAMTAIDLQYTGFAMALRRQYLARAALRMEDAAYRKQFDESLISREVFTDLQRDLGVRREAAGKRPPLDLGLRLAEMIRGVPLFKSLDPERLMDLARLLRARLAYPGETIMRTGDKGRAMYFIASGKVEVVLEDRRLSLGPGDFFGELALLTRQPRRADVVSVGYTHLLSLDGRDLRRLLRRDPALKETIENVASQRLKENEESAVRTAEGGDEPRPAA